MVVASPRGAGSAEGRLPLGVHLVGSVPLATAEDVFRTLSAGLGDRLRRLPDGETGPRADWIVWQYPVLSSRPQFEVAPPAPSSYRALPRLKLRARERGDDVAFESLGYAAAAAASYGVFARLKRDGVVPRGVRFQVSLPTPLAPISAFVALEDQPLVERAYENAMALEVARILDEIPHEQLALQWDTNFEFGMLEGDVAAWFADVETGILDRLVRISRAVPAEVELGFHFCSGHDEQVPRHVPADLSRMVGVANALAAALDRPLNWLHMPVARAEAAFAAPLSDLRLHPETELYLGVLHPGETDEETRRRLAAAAGTVAGFGLATPCGWGDSRRGACPELVQAHARLSRPVADPAAREGAVFDWGPFVRIPGEDWVGQPVDAFGLHYDTVENHGWYRNLDPTIDSSRGGSARAMS